MRCHLQWLNFFSDCHILNNARNTKSYTSWLEVLTWSLDFKSSLEGLTWSLVLKSWLEVLNHIFKFFNRQTGRQTRSTSWLVQPECLLIGWAQVPPDWSSQSVSWLVKPECLLIGQSRMPLDWSNFNASWLVKPECLLIGRARVPPDWSSQSAT